MSHSHASREPLQHARFTNAAASYLDERTKLGVAVKALGRKVFPDHWSFLLGEIALYCFVVLLITGTFLTLFFQASMTEVEYSGPYVPLKGIEMSAAMASTVDISFSVRGGLLIRQAHHWAALLFNAAIGVHLLRVFFTGAFRKPRELNWVIGFLLFVLAIAEGFSGYSLPDDVLSGNGLRIADGVAKSIPVVGTYVSFFLFGGEFPGTDIVGRLYMVHILLIPAILLLLVALHLMLVVIHKHSQYPGPGVTERNVVGYPILPVYAAKAGGFLFIVFGVMWAAASSDLIATHFQLAVEHVVLTLQIAFLLGPAIAFTLARRICLGLRAQDRSILLHGYESGRVVRMPGGEYVERHEAVDVYERWRLIDHGDYAPLEPARSANGRVRFAARIRAAASRFFFEDRIEPAPAEEAAESGASERGTHLSAAPDQAE